MGSGEGLFHVSRRHLAVSVCVKRAGKEGERETPGGDREQAREGVLSALVCHTDIHPVMCGAIFMASCNSSNLKNLT